MCLLKYNFALYQSTQQHWLFSYSNDNIQSSQYQIELTPSAGYDKFQTHAHVKSSMVVMASADIRLQLHQIDYTYLNVCITHASYITQISNKQFTHFVDYALMRPNFILNISPPHGPIEIRLRHCWRPFWISKTYQTQSSQPNPQVLVN